VAVGSIDCLDGADDCVYLIRTEVAENPVEEYTPVAEKSVEREIPLSGV